MGKRNIDGAVTDQLKTNYNSRWNQVKNSQGFQSLESSGFDQKPSESRFLKSGIHGNALRESQYPNDLDKVKLPINLHEFQAEHTFPHLKTSMTQKSIPMLKDITDSFKPTKETNWNKLRQLQDNQHTSLQQFLLQRMSHNNSGSLAQQKES